MSTVCWLSLGVLFAASSVSAQSVGLPAPRLLTTMPMGGTVGSEVEIIIAGDFIDDADELFFSDARISAKRKLGNTGQADDGKYVVNIAADCPPGIYEARVMTRLGLSTSRVFSAGILPEVIQVRPNTSLDQAMELTMNSICNAVMSAKAVDHYRFHAEHNKRYVIDCAAKAIDSKLEPVLIVADAEGKDLLVERRGGMLDFTAPKDGPFVIKVHELTFKGGPYFFYRLRLQELPADAPLPESDSTQAVSSFSWPPPGLALAAQTPELEPNNRGTEAQHITLPADLSGAFFPAADVDVFEFEGKQGEVWWVELASARLGRPTDAAILVQHVSLEGSQEQLRDAAEFNDIASPVKLSSNGYAYDGPPYDAGSPDVLGKLEIAQDGLYRLQVTDLFGGTRTDPRNVYRLVIRQAAPDFALVAWAFHMELRNGDRNALSKPLALRGGATLALEVVVVRRDGFDGEIELVMEDLPAGVRSAGLKIPSGKSRGILLITADQNAPRSLSQTKFYGRASIDGSTVVRPCRLAAMTWPVADSWSEIPEPRLVADVPVSVSGLETAPLTIAPAEDKVWEVKANEKLSIPLALTRRSEFSGSTLQLRTFGEAFERAAPFNVSLDADQAEAILDMAALKAPPGDYQIAFYGGAVAKYRYCPEAIGLAELAQHQAERVAADADADVQRLTDEASSVTAEQKATVEKMLADALARQKAAADAVAIATKRVQVATDKAKPKDIVDIVVSEPIVIRVTPSETK